MTSKPRTSFTIWRAQRLILSYTYIEYILLAHVSDIIESSRNVITVKTERRLDLTTI